MIQLEVRMALFSKARPRVTARGAFMPKEYRAKQKEMRRQLQEQWGDKPPLEGPISLSIEIFGEGRADADNIIGALMDSANGLLWTDDRVTIIPQISVAWEKAPKANSLWRITIHDAGQQTIS